MKSRSEEEDQKVPKASQPPPEEDKLVSTATDYECIQYLFDSLNTTEIPELEKTLALMVEMFSQPAILSYRKEINRLASSFAAALTKVKTERPFLLLAEILERAEAQTKEGKAAHVLLRLAVYMGNSVRLLQRVEEKKSKEGSGELRKLRKQLKQEEATLFFGVVEKLMLKADRLNEKSLDKIKTGLATIGKKAEFKVEAREVQGDSRESLIKIFLYGLARKSNPSLHSEVIHSLSALLGSQDILDKVKDTIPFYRPVLSHCTEGEIETTLAPQMVLLIKRSMDSFAKLAPILKAFGKLTPHSLSVLVQTTLEDLVAQEGAAKNYQELLVECLKSLVEKAEGEEMQKAVAEIVENLSYPWKQLLGASEMESGKQVSFLKILSCFLADNIPLNHQKTFLSMIVELHAGIKQEEVSCESAIFLSSLLKDLPTALYPNLYESYEAHIFSQSLKAAKSKNLMCSLLYPAVAHGVHLITRQNFLLPDCFPSLKRAAWNGIIAQLNFNAVTQFGYNTAVVALEFVLDARDCYGKDEPKPDANLKFVFAPANINRQDSIAQRSVSQLEASLHMFSVALSALIYPSFVETHSQAVLPAIANLLLQYAFSPKSTIRSQAIKMALVLYRRFNQSDLGWLFAKDYQMATYAFIKHVSAAANTYAPHVKSILVLMIEILKEVKSDINAKQFFVRIFILMHNAKAAGKGRNKRNLAEQIWSKLKKAIENAKELLKKTGSAILSYLVSGKSLMSSAESALTSEDQVQTILNVVTTMTREGMGKEVLIMLKKILSGEKLEQAENLYIEIIEERLHKISRFDLEFLTEEVNDL